jgi:hypothetical protein
MDKVMVTMSGYRKLRKPLEDKDEEEFLMELCNVLSVCCLEPAGKHQFLDYEGIELMFIMLRNRKIFRIGCIKVCMHAGHSCSDSSVLFQVLASKACTSCQSTLLDCRCWQTTASALSVAEML